MEEQSSSKKVSIPKIFSAKNALIVVLGALTRFSYCGKDMQVTPNKTTLEAPKLDLEKLNLALEQIQQSEAKIDLGRTKVAHTFTTTVNNTEIKIKKIPGTDITLPRPDKVESRENRTEMTVNKGFSIEEMDFSLEEINGLVTIQVTLPEHSIYNPQFLKESSDQQTDIFSATTQSEREQVQDQTEITQKEIIKKIVARHIYNKSEKMSLSAAKKLYPIFVPAIQVAKLSGLDSLEISVKIPYAGQEEIEKITEFDVNKFRVKTRTGNIPGMDLVSNLPYKEENVKIILDRSGNIKDIVLIHKKDKKFLD